MYKITLIHPVYEEAHKPVFSFIIDDGRNIGSNYVVIPSDSIREYFKEKQLIPVSNIKIITEIL